MFSLNSLSDGNCQGLNQDSIIITITIIIFLLVIPFTHDSPDYFCKMQNFAW